MSNSVSLSMEGVNIRLPTEIEKDDDSSQKKGNTKKALYLSLLVAFLLAAGIFIASFTISSLKKASICGLSLWQWSLLITVLLCGPLLSKLFQYLVDCLADTEYNITDNVIYYVVELANKAWVVLWFSMILVAWFWVVHQPSYLKMPVNNDKLKHKYIKIFDGITTTLTTILIGSFLWLIKDGVLTTKKASFHIKRFFDRVRRALMHQVIINELSIPKDVHGDEGFCGFIPGSGSKCCDEKIPNLSKVNKKNVSHLGMQKVIRWFLNNQRLTCYDAKQKKSKKIGSENEAREAATVIYNDGHGRENIRMILKKYTQKIEGETKDQVYEVMSRLVPKESKLVAPNAKEIQRKDVEELMVKMFRYREILSSSLRGNMRLFRAVNRVIDTLLVLFILALWLIMLRVETRNTIFVIASAIAGSAFLIGDTCGTLFNCWLLIFIVHPYDIGDCCLIEGTPVTIKSIGILATKAVTFDNEVKYYSNSKLFTELSITNYTRSDDLGDFVEFSPGDVTTTTIENGVKSYIKQKASGHWSDDYRLEKEFDNESKIKMKLHLKHTISFHDFKERQRRKSELVQEIKNILDKGMNDVAPTTSQEKNNVEENKARLGEE